MKSRGVLTVPFLLLLLVAQIQVSMQLQLVREPKDFDIGDLAFRISNINQLIVGLKDQRPHDRAYIERVAQKCSGYIIDTVLIGEHEALVVEFRSSSIRDFIKEVSNVASYVEPNWEWRTLFIPNDPSWVLQWGPRKIEADWAWNITLGSSEILVAVVDTGIDWDHPDLEANYVPLGYDWVNDDSDPMDDNGHGTHCAGIIAAVINNSIGIAGLAQVRIMAEKCLNQHGIGYSHWLANGIVHAVNQGAKIISMSWGGYFYSNLIHEAIKYAYEKGALLIAAAGNDAISAKLYPAGYDEVIAVSATQQDDAPAGFTNYGDWVELSAPGVNIYSTIWNNGYRYASGTSMAAPHVAGVAALTWSCFLNKPRDWIRMRLRYSADDLGVPGFDKNYGYGRVNARKAVEQPLPTHDVLVYSWKTPPYVEPNDLATIQATVLNYGSLNESNVEVRLLANGEIVDSVIIPSLPSGESTVLNLNWNPIVTGRYNITLAIAPLDGEKNLKNNVVSKEIYVGKPRKAVVLDSEGCYVSWTTRNWDVLNEKWHLYGTTMIYIDYTSLRKQDITYADIAATNADVLIISSAWSGTRGWEFTDSEIEAIKQYVEEGHGIIITEASFYYPEVPNNCKLAPLVGLDETVMWDYTTTYSLQSLKPQHPVLRNIPSYYHFPEVTTGIPTDGIWDSNELAGGEYIALGPRGKSSIVVYKRGRVYISPWLEGLDPLQQDTHLQLWYNAITWSPHELSVSLEAPLYVQPNTPVLINATAFNIGVVNEKNVVLKLLINGSIVESASIPQLSAGASHKLSYLWTPEEGVYNVTAQVEPVPGETFLANNTRTVIVKVTTSRDVAITQITCPNTCYTERIIKITVVAANLGEIVESFNVTLYYDSTVIGVQTVKDLEPGLECTLTFYWNTTNVQPCRSYTIRAKAEAVPNDKNLENNILVYGLVKVKLLGDVNGNGEIEIYDVVSVAGIYGCRKGDPKWNPEADLAKPWDIIDIYDVVVVASRYGRKC